MPQRRRHRPYVGIGEVGQTHSPTVGPNFVKALLKGFECNLNANVEKGTALLLAGLRLLGYVKLARELEPLVRAVVASRTQEAKERLWSKLGEAYTMEDSGDVSPTGEKLVLYRHLNRDIRNDAESLHLWAPFIGMLVGGGADPGYKCANAPEDVRPRRPQTTHRGFAVDPEVLDMYAAGVTFFWQALVSTSTRLEESRQFALQNAAEGQIPLVFDIQVRGYEDSGYDQFFVYDLDSVSVFPGEAEMLLLPYVRFTVPSEPWVDEEGATRIPLKIIDQPFTLSSEPKNVTVWVDPNGMSRDNYALAKSAFVAGMPQFRMSERGRVEKQSWGDYIAYDSCPGGLHGLGLFTDPEAALAWVRSEVKRDPQIVFRFLFSGRASVAFLDGYFSEATSSPCEVLVFCGDVPKWRGYWSRCPLVRVTGSTEEVKRYLQHKDYKIASDTFEPPCISPQTRVWYPWRRIDGGVVYGGGGANVRFVEGNKHYEGGWSQGAGSFPDVPMHPFD